MQKMRQTGKKRWEAMDVISLILMTLITLCIFIPFYNSIVISFSTSGSYLRNPFAFWPSEGTLANYTKVLKNGTIFSCYLNTILITVVGTVLSMSTSVAAAFAFSRKAFPGKRFVFMLMLFTMFFSGGTIPTYLTIKQLGLIDTRLCIILMCGVSTFNIIVLKNGFEQIPNALEEAAKIDGANDMQIFVRIMLPLLTAQIATFTLFTAVGYWNEWFLCMLYVTEKKLYPLQYLLMEMQKNSEFLARNSSMIGASGAEALKSLPSQTMRMAVVVFIVLPIACAYPFFQRYVVAGLTIGSVKG